MLYFVDKPFFQGSHAGVKPKNDLIQQLKKLGFQTLQNNIILNPEDIVFFYYPFSYDWERELFTTLTQSQVSTILFIMDIRSLTYEGESLKAELDLFNQANSLIVHNEQMKNWLLEQGIYQAMFCLKLFDYLVPEQIFENIPLRVLSNQVVFAGCLHPDLRKFLYDRNYNHSYQLNVYGPDLMEDINSHCTTYFGVYTPEEIPAYLKGSFGLHWNGANQHSCIGPVAEYSKIVTSHKVSLYSISKLPIICWDESSEANWIRENKLGILISSLDEIDDKLHEITEEEYEEMFQNVCRYANRLKEGYYFKRVIHDVLNHLES